MVARDVETGIKRLFPEKLGHPAETEEQSQIAEEIIREFELQGAAVTASSSGYLQSIDNDGLMNLARDNDLVILLKCRPGDFLTHAHELAQIRPRGRMSEQLAQEIRAFVLGTQRTHLQDVEFSLRQLVEVAVRSLSAGINDPFTAINCLDRITEALSLLAERSFPSPFRHDEEGNLRVIAAPVTFEAVTNAAFDSIRQYGRSSAPVTLRLLDAIDVIARRVQRDGDRAALLRQALMIERGARTGLAEERDRHKVQERFHRALHSLHYQWATDDSGADGGRAVES
jgi:uncharacterized membrane protein